MEGLDTNSRISAMFAFVAALASAAGFCAALSSTIPALAPLNLAMWTAAVVLLVLLRRRQRQAWGEVRP